MNTMAIVFSIVLIVFFAFSFKIFLCLFIYSDAKERSDNPLLWAVVVFFVPDFIGLLLYFIIGRKKMVACPACSARMPRDSRFCPFCGRKVSGGCEVGLSQSAKHLLAAAIASLVLLFLSVALLVILSVSGSFSM